jgi:cardiolipin synthase
MDGVVQKPLLKGNLVIPLVNGDAAYPAMIRAVDEAERSVSLSTYIFDNDEAGALFRDALVRAVSRNVNVRVLIDDMGSRYSWPPMDRSLHRAGVKTARFLPTLMPWRLPFMNLRNHRKILVVDGRRGFTGGMNIRNGHVLSGKPRRPVQDMNFQVDGPVVAHLQEAFAQDWVFATGELLQGDQWFPLLEEKGMMLARGIPDGPDEDFEKLRWTVEGALACAKSSVRIVTPYFLPDSALIRALNLASMRGVDVDIILPSVNNIPIVTWASFALFWQLLEYGCRIWLTKPPFDHTKLMIVDGTWVLFGSGNWDARSLRLNFEFNVECYSRELASELEAVVRAKLEGATEVTPDNLNSRSFPVRIRDGLARLFSPYL